MPDVEKPAFDPFLSLALTRVNRQPYQTEGVQTLAIAANSPGYAIVCCVDAKNARALAAHLNEAADILDPPKTAEMQKEWQVKVQPNGDMHATFDPPLIVTDKILGGPQRKVRKSAKKVRKVKRK